MSSDQIPRIYDHIRGTIIPDAIGKFIEKSKDYPQSSFMELGSRGQFSDIWRKIPKLKKAVWDGEKLRHEQPEEIVQDIIGHCFLLLFCLKYEANPEIWSWGDDD